MVLILLLLAGLVRPLHGQAPTSGSVEVPDTPPSEQTASRIDDDEPTAEGVRIVPWLSVGGALSSDFESFVRPTPLGAAAFRNRENIDTSFQLRTLAVPGPGIEVYSRLELTRDLRVSDGRLTAVSGLQFQVRELYVEWVPSARAPIGVQIGRQRFRDEQEWWFDEYLDAVRLRGEAGRWRFDAALAMPVTRTPRDQRDENEKPHAIVQVSRRVTRAMRATGFVVARRDPSPARDEPIWFGASLASRLKTRVTFGSHAAIRRGRSQETRLAGWAADAAISLHTSGRRLSMTAGYAVASGDADGTDGVDANFRQTGLADNAGRFGGIRRMRLFGEVFDPELSNLAIPTLALSLRPARAVSLDVAWHAYRQRVARRRLGENAFDQRANGQQRRLGEEIDVQLVWRPSRRLDVMLAGGVFVPGPAFDGVATSNHAVITWRPQARFYF